MPTSNDDRYAAGYARHGDLAARQSIYQFEDEAEPFTAWAVRRIPRPTSGPIIDVGCGNGLYVNALVAEGVDPRRLVAADRSSSMLRAIPGGDRLGGTIQADARRLPLAPDCAATVLAMHMLYHCGSVNTAITELRRILRPGGTLVASTNARDDRPELRDLYAASLHAAGVTADFGWGDGAFDLSNGAAQLGTEFSDVFLERRTTHLVIRSPEPIVAYFDSLRSFEPDAVDDERRDAASTEVRRRAVEVIVQHGHYRVTKTTGVFHCR